VQEVKEVNGTPARLNQMLVEMVENMVLSLVPSAVTVLTITIAINTAIMAYSIEVTPDSSSMKLLKRLHS
jgi:hypothetical protein